MHTTKVLKATKVKPSSTALIREYRQLLDEEKRISARKEEILAAATERMEKEKTIEFGDDNGKFMRITRTSYAWTVDAVKAVFPKSWQMFVKADDKQLKGLVSAEHEKADTLSKLATVKTSEVTTFVRN